jgi:hypothetical protein
MKICCHLLLIVEGSAFYGLSLTARTLLPGWFYRFNQKNSANYETICEPQIKSSCGDDGADLSVPLDQKSLS